MKRTTLVLLTALALLTAVPAASSTTADAGVSGQCYDDTETGGQDEARVTVDAEEGDVDVIVPEITDPENPGEGGHAVEALATFATGFAEAQQSDDEDADACDATYYEQDEEEEWVNDEDRYDYLEASVGVGDDRVQVCYDGDVPAEEECPTSPHGEPKEGSPDDPDYDDAE